MRRRRDPRLRQGRRSDRGLDWQRISRFSLLGSIVMCLWLLAPTISCTFTSFREEPLTEYMDESSMEAGEMDRERVDQSKSFFGSIIDSAGMCYEEKPLTQQGWKTKLLYGLLGLWLVTKLFGHFWVMRQKPR